MTSANLNAVPIYCGLCGFIDRLLWKNSLFCPLFPSFFPHLTAALLLSAYLPRSDIDLSCQTFQGPELKIKRLTFRNGGCHLFVFDQFMACGCISSLHDGNSPIQFFCR